MTSTLNPVQGSGDLPELPEGANFVKVFYASTMAGDERYYTADQMREYGRRCAEAAAPRGAATEESRRAARYDLLRNWCVRQHKLYVTDGNNPAYEEELDRRLDKILAATASESAS